jgi:hypothetical protein
MIATHPEPSSDLMSCSQVENRTPGEHSDCAYGSPRRCTGRREQHSEGRVGDQGSARCDFLGSAFGRMYSPATGKARLGYRLSKKRCDPRARTARAGKRVRQPFELSSPATRRTPYRARYAWSFSAVRDGNDNGRLPASSRSHRKARGPGDCRLQPGDMLHERRFPWPRRLRRR